MKSYSEYIDPIYENLNIDEQNKINEFINKLKEEDLENINESFISDLLGGTLGFLIGPSLGKKIADALGIGPGPLYDMFTSKLVNIKLGTVIAKGISGGYKENK